MSSKIRKAVSAAESAVFERMTDAELEAIVADGPAPDLLQSLTDEQLEALAAGRMPAGLTEEQRQQLTE